MTAERGYLPAAGHDWLLPFYDPLQRLLGGDALRQSLVDAAGLRGGHRVLDVGCGTGSLVTVLAGSRPDVRIVGLDPDPKALARARRKLARAGVDAELRQGFSERLPFGDGEFDRVFSTFMFHHLAAPAKQATLAEVRRVLAPDGELHLLDFANADEHAHGLLARLLTAHGHAESSETLRDALASAGFDAPAELSSRRTWFGRVAHWRGRAAAAGRSAR